MNSRLSAGIGIAPDSGAATDLNRLHQLKVGKNRDSEANVHKVAQEFESLFLNEMMKAMRSANAVFAEGNFMNSNESKTYQDMHDQQLAITMSKQNGVGLADVLERQLSKTLHGAGSSRPNPFAQVAASSGVTAATPAADEAVVRDDSKLLNQRRISLPPRLADRLLAGIVPPAGGSEAQAQAPQNWLAAKSYPAPADKSLSIADSDAITGRRLAQPPLAPGKAAFSSPEEFVATMLDSDPEHRISITIVPYNAQVNLGPVLRGKYNATNLHGVANVNCLELPFSVYDAPGISRTLPLPMMAYADHAYGTSMIDGYVSPTSSSALPNYASEFCRQNTYGIVRLPSQDSSQTLLSTCAAMAGSM